MGYSHANDRFVQMALQRVIAKGQLANIKGSKQNLELDKLFRKMNFESWYEMNFLIMTINNLFLLL